MRVRTILFVLAVLTCLPHHARAEDYPDRPIRLIVPAPPGGAADIMSRIIADKIRISLHQPIIVENRPGANGNLAAEYVRSAPADGYMLMMGTIGLLTINPHVYEDVKFNPLTDFAPVALATTYPNVLVVNNKLPIHSVAELVEYAKKNPTALLYSSSGFGNSFYMGFEMLKHDTGIKAVHVPYAGTASALAAVIAGDVNVAFSDVMVAAPQIAANRLRGIAVSGRTRTKMLPDVPTVAESGVAGLTDFNVVGWNGFVVKAGTPPERISLLNEQIRRALTSPDGMASISNLGADPAGDTPEEFGAFLRAEDAKWGGLVKDANLQVDK
jgi:tripartite-type tricarboxylate transporter receptor subunit TctC